MMFKNTFLKPNNIDRLLDSRNSVQIPRLKLQNLGNLDYPLDINKFKLSAHKRNQAKDEYAYRSLERTNKNGDELLKAVGLKMSSRKNVEVANFKKIVKKNTRF